MHVRNLRVERMDLSLTGCLLGHLILPLSLTAVEQRIGLAILAVLTHAHGLCWQLVLPSRVTFGGFCASSCNCFHWRYVAAGVLIHSLAVSLRRSVLERGWIDASLSEFCFNLSPSNLKWFIHGFWCSMVCCAASADSRYNVCSASLTIQDFQSLASLLSRCIRASNSSS